jgi:hypothetical protein
MPSGDGVGVMVYNFNGFAAKLQTSQSVVICFDYHLSGVACFSATSLVILYT